MFPVLSRSCFPAALSVCPFAVLLGPRRTVLEAARDSIRTFVSRVFSLAAGAVLSVIVARWLGPERQGLYSLCMAASLVAALLVNCGLGLSSVYFLGKRIFSPGEIASASLGFALTVGSLGFLVSTLIVTFFKVPGLSGAPHIALVLALVSIPFYNLCDYYFYFLIGSDRIKQFNVLSAARNTLQLLLAVFLIVLGGLRLNGAILSWVGSFVGTVLIAHFLIRRFAAIRLGFTTGILKASVVFGIKGYLSRIASFLYYRIDMFILSYFMGAKAVGQYAIAVLIAELLWNIPRLSGTGGHVEERVRRHAGQGSSDSHCVQTCIACVRNCRGFHCSSWAPAGQTRVW